MITRLMDPDNKKHKPKTTEQQEKQKYSFDLNSFVIIMAKIHSIRETTTFEV